MARLSAEELAEALAPLTSWRQHEGQLVRECTLRDAVEALGFIVQIAALQERVDHHATITVSYNRVHIALTTHDEGGVTERDIALAHDIEERAQALGA